MRLSYWDRSELEKEQDVLVLGAGIVGLSAAIDIAERYPSMSIRVVDRMPYGALASSRNAGFACFGSISEIYADIENYGEDITFQLVQRRRKGLERLKNIFGEGAIRYEQLGAHEVFEYEDDYNLQSSRIRHVNDLMGEEIFSSVDTPDYLDLHHKSIHNAQEGQIDTGRFYSLLEAKARILGIQILRGVNVDKLYDSGRCACTVAGVEEGFYLSAAHILLASNALSRTLLPELSVEAVRNQVIITRPIKNCPLKGCFHQDEGYIYYRNVGERILIGGGRHLYSGEGTSVLGENKDNISFLTSYLTTYMSDLSSVEIEASWSGILSGGNQRFPIVRRINTSTVAAVRLSGMGVAIGLDIGHEAATLLID